MSTEACILTSDNHPVSIFSELHSSKEKNFTSINIVMFSAMERGEALFGKAVFIMGRGYNDFRGKWIPATQLRNQRKDKIKPPLYYRDRSHDAYLSHVKVQITASQKDICLVLVYGITEHPMMLATNKKILSKEDVIGVAESNWHREFSFPRKYPVYRLFSILFSLSLTD